MLTLKLLNNLVIYKKIPVVLNSPIFKTILNVTLCLTKVFPMVTQIFNISCRLSSEIQGK